MRWPKGSAAVDCSTFRGERMSIYKRDDVLPEWEPIPWDAHGPHVDEQERGFHARAQKPLVWKRVDWNNFPANGVFGRNRDWFASRDIAYITTFENEDLILIRNTWFGFPDPPEWALGSRPEGNAQARWTMWGHFLDLPPAWVMLEA